VVERAPSGKKQKRDFRVNFTDSLLQSRVCAQRLVDLAYFRQNSPGLPRDLLVFGFKAQVAGFGVTAGFKQASDWGREDAAAAAWSEAFARFSVAEPSAGIGEPDGNVEA